jgi:RNA recognition motif-containing protein
MNQMEKKLYVGGLSYNTSEETLQHLFETAGEVSSVNIITDRDSGRSKGFGFVEMADVQGSIDAIEKHNGAELDGRRLTVSEAKPQAPRSSRGSYGDRSSSYGDRSSNGGARSRW